MKRKTAAGSVGAFNPPPAERRTLDKKAEKYLREGGKIEDLPEGKRKDKHPQHILKTVEHVRKRKND
jgi:hypothetical protein